MKSIPYEENVNEVLFPKTCSPKLKHFEYSLPKQGRNSSGISAPAPFWPRLPHWSRDSYPPRYKEESRKCFSIGRGTNHSQLVTNHKQTRRKIFFSNSTRIMGSSVLVVFRSNGSSKVPWALPDLHRPSTVRSQSPGASISHINPWRQPLPISIYF